MGWARRSGLEGAYAEARCEASAARGGELELFAIVSVSKVFDCERETQALAAPIEIHTPTHALNREAVQGESRSCATRDADASGVGVARFTLAARVGRPRQSTRGTSRRRRYSAGMVLKTLV